MNDDRLHSRFQSAFNANDLDALVALYTDDAVLIPQPGTVARGKDQITTALQHLLDLGGLITVNPLTVVEVGDLAYLSNRWSLVGTNSDGDTFEMGAITAEVARRQPDGGWLYVIDNAWGEQHTDDR